MRRSRVVTAALGGCAAVFIGGCAFGMPSPATEQAESTFTLWQINFVAAAIVAGIVYGLILWSILRHRRRKGDPDGQRGASFRDNRKLEVVYTTIPIVIVVVLFVLALSAEQKVTAVSPDPDLVVQTEAYTWGWRFTYPEQDIRIVSPPVGESNTIGPGPELVLPVGQTTRIELSANDTIHAFWVPGFLFKRDAIPGHPTEFDVTPTTTGTYRGVCAELCGYNHAYMVFTVKVVTPEEFDEWTAQHSSLEAFKGFMCDGLASTGNYQVVEGAIAIGSDGDESFDPIEDCPSPAISPLPEAAP